MRRTLQLVCITALLAASSASFAVTAPRPVPGPSFPRGAWQCQTPPGSETLLPVRCGCHATLSAAQQKEYARLSQVPAGRLTRYDQSHVFQINQAISRSRPYCLPDEPPHFPGPFQPTSDLRSAAPAEVGDNHAPALPVLGRPLPVLKRSIITPPPRLSQEAAARAPAPVEVGDQHAPALPVLGRPAPVLRRSIIISPRLPPPPPLANPRNPPRTKYRPIPDI